MPKPHAPAPAKSPRKSPTPPAAKSPAPEEKKAAPEAPPVPGTPPNPPGILDAIIGAGAAVAPSVLARLAELQAARDDDERIEAAKNKVVVHPNPYALSNALRDAEDAIGRVAKMTAATVVNHAGNETIGEQARTDAKELRNESEDVITRVRQLGENARRCGFVPTPTPPR